ncbi:MAG: type II secretion system F family protein [Actinomycetes bacterium]|jgi:tight adherence protein C|nr:type II secretion system F family protein [Actinomycetes bacterium]
MSSLRTLIIWVLAALSAGVCAALATSQLCDRIQAGILARRQRHHRLLLAGGGVIPDDESVLRQIFDALHRGLDRSLVGRRLFVPMRRKRALQARRDSCVRDLPDMVDVMRLAFDAGLSFDQAFDLYLDRFDNELARCFLVARQSWQVGMQSRIRALEDVAADIGEESLFRMIAALRQAFALGSALGPAFETLSFEVRRYRKAALEEQIAKTPVKILVPLGVCLLPAILILIMGPIMSQALSGLAL